MILTGTLAIKSKIHPRMLEVKLKSFLTPSLRNNKLVSIERIRKMLKLKNDSKEQDAPEEADSNVNNVDSEESLRESSAA
jgi:chemotaxis protein MotA